MNFLAHLYLSPQDGPALIGSLMPDIVRIRSTADLHPRVKLGVDMHRGIDSFTDRHPIFQCTRGRLRTTQGVFSPILVDILYDHCLARDWSNWHDISLQEFTASVISEINRFRHLMPSRMQDVVATMSAERWLTSYRSHAGLRLTLDRMSARLSRRFSRPIDLASVVDHLDALDGSISKDFDEFFPQLCSYAQTFLQDQKSAED